MHLGAHHEELRRAGHARRRLLALNTEPDLKRLITYAEKYPKGATPTSIPGGRELLHDGQPTSRGVGVTVQEQDQRPGAHGEVGELDTVGLAELPVSWRRDRRLLLHHFDT